MVFTYIFIFIILLLIICILRITEVDCDKYVDITDEREVNTCCNGDRCSRKETCKFYINYGNDD